MLRFEGFRLEVQVLALVIPLVSDVVPEHLSGYLDGVGLRNAQSAPRSHEVSAEILGVVVVGERGFWLGQLGLEGKCVGKGILHSECPGVLLEIRVEGVVIAPIVGLCVVAATEGSLEEIGEGGSCSPPGDESEHCENNIATTNLKNQ